MSTMMTNLWISIPFPLTILLLLYKLILWLIKEFAIWFFFFFGWDFTIEISLWFSFFKIELCRTLIYLIFSFRFILLAFVMVTWLSQCTNTIRTGLSNKYMYFKRLLSHLTFVQVKSKAINFDSMVDRGIIVYLADF